MNIILIYVWVWIALFAMSFWEASVEGRKAWDKGKCGFKIKIPLIGMYSTYHIFLALVMLPMLIIGLPLIIGGWNLQLFFILISAFLSGMIIEDFGWYVVNPKVKLKELYTPFSDYYPWLRIGKQKILPWFYIVGAIISIVLLYLALRI